MRIQEIKRYRFEATEDEVRAIAAMFQHFEDTSQDDDDTSLSVRRAFGIKGPTPRDEVTNEDERDETLPEKAIRQSQGRRKSRLTQPE